MSTSELWTNIYSPCPCGCGRILEHVDSPDNAWSRTTRDYELDCKVCSKVWILLDKELRHRAAHEASSRAYTQKSELSRELKKLGCMAIDMILNVSRLSTPKQEYAALQEAGVCSEGPIRYKRARDRGISAGSMCSPLSNVDWIVARLPDRTLTARIEELSAQRNMCEAQIVKARQEMNVTPIESLRPATP